MKKKIVITIACVAGALVFTGAGFMLAWASKPRIIANIQQEGQIQTSSPNQGTGQQGGFVTLENAKEAALADAGLNSADVTFFKEREEIDDGIMIYDIEFFTSDTKYEYEINGITGAVMERKSEMFQNNNLLGAMAQNPDGQNAGSQEGSQGQNTGGQSTDGQNTGSQSTDGQSTGSQSSGSQSSGSQSTGGQSSSSQSSGSQSSGSQSSGSQSAGGQSSGSQNSGGQSSGSQSSGGQSSGGQSTPAPSTPAPSTPAPSSGGQTQQSNLIGVAAAKEIALSDAGLSAGSVTFRKEKQDWDDGIAVYDIEFYTSDMEYEYEIHGTTGAILDKSIESFHQGSGQPSGGGASASTGNDIGVDQAKAIAVAHAGLSMSDVTFSKAKLDWDDGYTVYEVEFYYGATEYDYTIDAYTGTILEYDYDWD